MTDIFEKLKALPPKDIYSELLSRAEQSASESALGLGRHLASFLSADRQTRRYAVYALFETLRIVAPENPCADKEMDRAFEYLASRAPREKEGTRALEIAAKYKMVALVESSKIVNELAELSVDNVSKTWARDMLESILEEKEEDLGKEVKRKIVKKIAEGCAALYACVENHPLVFSSSMEDLIRASDKRKILLIKKFNLLNKEALSRDFIEQAVDTLAEKKEFLKFVSECSVRREVLDAVAAMSEDKSPWIRANVPVVLFKKSKDAFYTAAVSSEVRNRAREIFSTRMHDPSSQVRAEVLKLLSSEDILEMCSKDLILERARDVDRSVRAEAIRVVTEIYSKKIQYDLKRIRINPAIYTGCAICLRKDKTPGFIVPLLLTVFISEHQSQLELVSSFFKAMDETEGGKEIFPQVMFSEVFEHVEKSPCDADSLTGCVAARYLLEVQGAVDVQTCESHSTAGNILKKLLNQESVCLRTNTIDRTTPPVLVVMAAETYAKGAIPEAVLLALKSLISEVTKDLFYKIARILTVSEYSGGSGWSGVSDSKDAQEYLEIKRMCTSDSGEFSLDISRITENLVDESASLIGDIQMEEKKLLERDHRTVIMVQMDFLECCVRSALLERAAMKILLSGSYVDHAYFDQSVFFKQRVLVGAKLHPDSEIRLLFTVIYVLISRSIHMAMTEKGLLDALALLSWFFVEYNSTRGAEVVSSVFVRFKSHASVFFSVFANLKRFKVQNEQKQTSLYVLSEEVQDALVKECVKAGANPAQYSRDMPPSLFEDLKIRGGWATSLMALDDDQFSSNLLTTFKRPANK